ncbi:MAG: molecular chaperone DnaJ, partial [Bdellovibrionaceae bacterium]|nr:molecular chaperone DnaJ [Pseudobdellovibrionaceae bacterium]
SGAKPGSRPVTCQHCGGSGEVAFQQGFFQIRRPCQHCGGSGQTISDPCSTCHGSGKTQKRSQISVNIPAGIDTGQRLKLNNEGEAGEQGGPPGDLYVVVQVLEHDFFTREMDDIVCEVPITFVQASLGTEIEVPTLEGKVKMKIPPGTQSHKVFRLKNKGLPRLRSYGKGDQLVQVVVETPTKLNKEQKQLLRSFEESQGKSCHPNHERFFEKVRNLFG